ncbi:streptophobe family protein, partial [Streptomyces sp. NPDC049577]|uniref:streptophobe family protein n=1 Tax=Streptomyces sp. NPDC049577 TaxID=3155153 RepID=UPI00343F0688
VLVLAVGAGLAAAVVAAFGDAHPGRVLGGALLGAPNGVWLGVPLGLFVPWRGTAGGSLLTVLPDPLNRLLDMRADEAVTLGRLAGYEPLVWLLAVGSALLMLTAGVLAAARTPRGPGGPGGFALRCGLSLGAVTAVGLPLLVLATRVKADASLSVLGVDAVGAALDLRGNVPAALGLGALWGFGAGVCGAVLACAAGVARRAPRRYPEQGPYRPSPGYRASREETNPYLRPPADDGRFSAPTETAAPPPPPAPPRRKFPPTPPPGPPPRLP